MRVAVWELLWYGRPLRICRPSGILGYVCCLHAPSIVGGWVAYGRVRAH
jgi:hypothetical protein